MPSWLLGWTTKRGGTAEFGRKDGHCRKIPIRPLQLPTACGHRGGIDSRLSLAPHPPKFPLLPAVLPSLSQQGRVGCGAPGSPRTMSCRSRLTVAASLLAMQV